MKTAVLMFGSAIAGAAVFAFAAGWFIRYMQRTGR